MYWSVDGGTENSMYNSWAGSAHKEAIVDVANWNWQSSNTYSVAFVAKDSNGAELARTTFNVTTTSPTPIVSMSTTTTTPTATTSIKSTPATATVSVPSAPTTSVAIASSSVLPTANLYVDPNSTAKQLANAWRSSRPADASQIDKIAAQAGAKWFGGWNTNLAADVNNYVTAAATASSVPVLVAYNIPERDCGGYSAGGTTPDGYVTWIHAMAAAIGNHPALVVLEPDSVANLGCLSSSDQATRLSLLSQAVSILKANAGTRVYLDAGHPQWISASEIASRLNQAGISNADGFTLNVSNFYTTANNISFGQSVSSAVHNKHFIIDTSRNGNGPTSDNQWCNPAGRALGERPTLQTGNSLIDAYLWVKAPGESDGNCNGGPNAGTWWPDYALGLAERAIY
jgi:endoglucanase